MFGIYLYSNGSDAIDEYLDTPYELDYSMLYAVKDNTELIVSKALGFFVIFITVGMLIVTACDVLYIVNPVIRCKFDAWDMSGRNPKRVGKLRLVSMDARDAMIKANTEATGVSPVKIYIGKRIGRYLICALLLALCLNSYNDVVRIITKIVLDILNGLGYSR